MTSAQVQDWNKIVGLYRESGLSIRQYAIQNGLKYSTLTYHLRSHARKTAGQTGQPFVRLKADGDSCRPEYQTKDRDGVSLIIKVNGSTIRIEIEGATR